MYGTTLRLPGEYFDDSISDTNTSDISNYVTKLKLIMQHFKAIPLRPTANRKTYVTGFRKTDHIVTIDIARNTDLTY